MKQLMRSPKSKDLQPVKASDAEERSRLGQLRPAWAMALYTLETARRRRSAWSTRRGSRASNACQSQQITPSLQMELFTLQSRANFGSHYGLKQAIVQRPNRSRSSMRPIRVT